MSMKSCKLSFLLIKIHFNRGVEKVEVPYSRPTPNSLGRLHCKNWCRNYVRSCCSLISKSRLILLHTPLRFNKKNDTVHKLSIFIFYFLFFKSADTEKEAHNRQYRRQHSGDVQPLPSPPVPRSKPGMSRTSKRLQKCFKLVVKREKCQGRVEKDMTDRQVADVWTVYSN